MIHREHEYLCKKVREKIKINGKTTDKTCWPGLNSIDDFKFPWFRKGDLKQKTCAKLGWDRNFLYLFYFASDCSIVFKNRGLKGQVWKDDVVEIFISPDIKTKEYFGFEINAGGDILDYKAKEYRKFDYKWKAKGLKYGTNIVKSKYFTAEMAIPFKVLEIKPKDGVSFHAGLFRVDHNSGRRTEYSLWKPNGHHKPDYHRLKSFGKIILKDN